MPVTKHKSSSESIPFDADAERRVLGAVLLDQATHWPQCDSLTAEHFYEEPNPRIFRGILELSENGEPIEPLSLYRFVDHSWRAYVSELPDDIPPGPQLDFHIGRLHECYFLRRMQQAVKRTDATGVLTAARTAVADFESTAQRNSLPQILSACEFNPAKRPPLLRPVYSIVGVPICSPGNLCAVTAHSKAGKSAFVGGMLSAAMASGNADTLAITSENPHGKAVLHFDTEQGDDDHWNLIDRAIRRANAESKPPWLHSYLLTGMPAQECRDVLMFACAQASRSHGGVHSVHLDGVADFVADVNDPKECNPFVAELHGLARRIDAPIIGVIHFNPGGEKGREKTRGHLGSQLERKAETNLRLERDEHGITTVWSEKQRRAPILKKNGPCFRWSDEAGMHVSCAHIQAVPATVTAFQCEVESVYADHQAMRYADLKSTVMTVLKKESRTAERRIAKYVTLGLIQKTVANLWEKAA